MGHNLRSADKAAGEQVLCLAQIIPGCIVPTKSHRLARLWVAGEATGE